MAEKSLLNNRYELKKTLGSGGMAVVFLAHDQMLERSVAIKVLREDYSRDPAFRERFHQEAKAAANLSHPNIVTVHDFGMDAGRLFIVMEYVPGTNLNALLQTRGRFTVEETLPLMEQACAGIGYAHRAGLVHCDVKPHNFLITPDNRVKVTDFGIARALASIHPDEKVEVVWGSPQYFAPEQAAGGAPSPASDVYSLGVVMYYMLTGRLPFSSTEPDELARLHRDALPPPPRSINAKIPETLEQVVLKVLAKEPTSRYRTADQLGRVLIALERGTVTAQQRVQASLERTRVASAPQTPPTQVGQPGTLAAPVNRPAPVASGTQAARTQRSSGGDQSYTASRTIYSAGQSTPAASDPMDVDWLTVVLGLGALIAAGGLIPFWLWIYLMYFPPR